MGGARSKPSLNEAARPSLFLQVKKAKAAEELRVEKLEEEAKEAAAHKESSTE